jgi:hypothetical protein
MDRTTASIEAEYNRRLAVRTVSELEALRRYHEFVGSHAREVELIDAELDRRAAQAFVAVANAAGYSARVL